MVRITSNALPKEITENRNQLVVRKVGMPPLLVFPPEKFHQKGQLHAQTLLDLGFLIDYLHRIICLRAGAREGRPLLG